MQIKYRTDLFQDHPHICGGIVYATDLKSGPTPALLAQRYVAEQQATLARIQTPLSEIPSVVAWRRAFRRFGVNPTKYRSATEALLRRLTKKGDIPSINILVDIGNLISIRYGLPIAMFDVRGVTGGITVHPADGTEHFTELDRDERIHPEVGEVVFSDEAGMVLARRWCWRQSAQSAAQADTNAILATIESQHEHGKDDVAAAIEDMQALLVEFAGGTCVSQILDAENPLFQP